MSDKNNETVEVKEVAEGVLETDEKAFEKASVGACK